jgi:hypothetical protein
VYGVTVSWAYSPSSELLISEHTSRYRSPSPRSTETLTVAFPSQGHEHGDCKDACGGDRYVRNCWSIRKTPSSESRSFAIVVEIWYHHEWKKKSFTFRAKYSGFGGLEVACWPLVPKVAGSNPAEAVGFLRAKNPQHAFLRRGSKAVCPTS